MSRFEYEQTAKNSGPWARCLAISLFLVAAALVLTSLSVEAYRSILQLCALLVLTVAVLLTVRFVVKTYVYRLEARADGGHDLVIVDVQAKARRVVVRLSVQRQAARLLTRPGDISAAIADKTLTVYRYCTDLFPKGTALLVARDGDEDVAVLFQPDETLRTMLVTLLERRDGPAPSA